MAKAKAFSTERVVVREVTETEAIVRAVERSYPEMKWNSFEYSQMSPLLEGHPIFKDTPNG